MSRWKLRACPRCRGDVYVEKENEDAYERCLQCGYSKQISGAFLRTGTGKKDEITPATKRPERVLSTIY